MTFMFPVLMSLIPLGISVILIAVDLYLWSRARVEWDMSDYCNFVRNPADKKKPRRRRRGFSS